MQTTEEPRADGPSTPIDDVVPPATASGGHRLLDSVVRTFVVVFIIFMISPIADTSDSHFVPYTARSLLHDGDLDLSEFGVGVGDDYALVDNDGQVVSYFPWMTAALTVPFVMAVDALSATGLVPSVGDQIGDRSLGTFQRGVAGVFSAAAVTVLALVTRRLLRLAGDSTDGTGRTDSWWFLPLAGLILGLGTSAWSTASRGLWQHGPGLLLLGGAWLAALHVGRGTSGSPARRDLTLALASGALCGIAFWTRPTNAVFAGALFAFLAVRRRDVLTRWSAAALAAVVIGGLANVALLGTPLPAYFSAGRLSLHDQLPLAIINNLVGPSRGLLLFSPFLVLGPLALLPRRRRLLGDDVAAFGVAAVAASIAALVIVSGYADHWWGGHSYGPRFMSESIAVLGPLALVTAFGPRPPGARARALSTVVAPVLIAVSVVAHTGGSLTSGNICWNQYPVDVDGDIDRLWDWSDAQALSGPALIAEHGPGDSSVVCRIDRRS